MKKIFKNIISYDKNSYKKPQSPEYENEKLKIDLLDNIINIRKICSNSDDITIQKIKVSGIECAIITCEGMYDLKSTAELFLS